MRWLPRIAWVPFLALGLNCSSEADEAPGPIVPPGTGGGGGAGGSAGGGSSIWTDPEGEPYCPGEAFCLEYPYVFEDLTDVHGAEPESVWVVGSRGMVLHSRSGGEAWLIVDVPTTEDLRAVYATSREEAWAVGDGGTILRFDGGSWTTVESPVAAQFLDVYAPGPGEAWIVGIPEDPDDGGVVLHATDGTLERVTSTAFPRSMTAVHGTGADNVWLAGGFLDRPTFHRWDGFAVQERSYFPPTTVYGPATGLWVLGANEFYATSGEINTSSILHGTAGDIAVQRVINFPGIFRRFGLGPGGAPWLMSNPPRYFDATMDTWAAATTGLASAPLSVHSADGQRPILVGEAGMLQASATVRRDPRSIVAAASFGDERYLLTGERLYRFVGDGWEMLAEADADPWDSVDEGYQAFTIDDAGVIYLQRSYLFSGGGGFGEIVDRFDGTLQRDWAILDNDTLAGDMHVFGGELWVGSFPAERFDSAGQPLPLPSCPDGLELWGDQVWRYDGGLWFISSSGVLQTDGATCTVVDPPVGSGFAIDGSSLAAATIVYGSSPRLAQSDGSGWQDRGEIPEECDGRPYVIAPNDVWILGSETLCHWDGEQIETFPEYPAVQVAWGRTPAGLRLGGGNGFLLRPR